MTHEVYAPRPVSNLGIWSFPGLDLKVYGLSADDRPVTDEMEKAGRHFVLHTVLPAKPALGAVFILVGTALLLQWHHRVESWLLDIMPYWLQDLSVAL